MLVWSAYLVLPLLLILIDGPPLSVVAVRHFVRADKLDAAKVFGSLGDDARHLGRYQQVHLSWRDTGREVWWDQRMENVYFLDFFNKKKEHRNVPVVLCCLAHSTCHQQIDCSRQKSGSPLLRCVEQWGKVHIPDSANQKAHAQQLGRGRPLHLS